MSVFVEICRIFLLFVNNLFKVGIVFAEIVLIIAIIREAMR